MARRYWLGCEWGVAFDFAQAERLFWLIPPPFSLSEVEGHATPEKGPPQRAPFL